MHLLERSSLRIGMKVVLVIVLIEAAIMAAFRLLGVPYGSEWTGIIDALLLGFISSAVIYVWVVRPLHQAKQQNDLFNTLVSNVDVGVVITDPKSEDNPIIFVNQAYTRITGYSADEVIGRNPRLMQGDDVDQEALETTRQAIREERSVRTLQRNRRKDGQSFWNDLHLNPIFDQHGAVQFWVGLINDVTATRELEKENRLWASALQQSDEAVCVFAADGMIEVANEAFCNNVRLSREEVVGSSVMAFWDKEAAEYSCIEDCIKQQSSWSGRHQRSRGDHTTYESLSSVTPIHDEHGGVSFICVHRDISDMVAMEAQLRQSQKMEAIGLLVGGIAHDFNNVLAGILGNLYLVKQKLTNEPKLVKRIEGVEEQGYAAAGMIRQLLGFSRKSKPECKNMNLKAFTKELAKFARVSIPENIRLSVQGGDKDMVISCDPVQMQQSLLNIIVNATHAVQEKHIDDGFVEVELLPAEKPDHLIYDDRFSDQEMPQGWVCIRIQDNGIGMDEGTLNNAFTPFFTTKSSGAGTGLGLAMVQSYIETLHGCIDVKSSPGEGTCFEIYLPLVSRQSTQVMHESRSLRTGSKELILVADDESSVLDAMSDILESANYRVIRASNGEDAMSKFSEHAGNLHLAILDVVMPKLGGLQAARRMRTDRADFPVVLMTGYDKENAIPDAPESDFLILRKPWDIPQLNNVLERALSDSIDH